MVSAEQPSMAGPHGSNPIPAREPAVAQTAASLNGAPPAPAASTGAPAAHDAFAALDGEPGLGTPAWVHAGTRRAEAGFEDPSLGWIGVRAEGGGAGIHAALVPESADAAQALGGHLAGLNAYLADRHTPVEAVTLAAPEARQAERGMEQAAGQDPGHGAMNQGAHQGMGQDPGQGAQAGQAFQAETGGTAPVTGPGVAEQAEGIGSAAPAYYQGGTHISVMA